MEIDLAGYCGRQCLKRLGRAGEHGHPAKGVDLLHIGMVLRKNGGFVNSGTGAAVFNHPANAVAWLANKLSEFGIALREGEIVLSGAFTAADPVQGPARYVATFGQWGEVEVTFH